MHAAQDLHFDLALYIGEKQISFCCIWSPVLIPLLMELDWLHHCSFYSVYINNAWIIYVVYAHWCKCYLYCTSHHSQIILLNCLACTGTWKWNNKTRTWYFTTVFKLFRMLMQLLSRNNWPAFCITSKVKTLHLEL